VAAEFTRQVAADMPSRYAEASGDHNPIHLDDAVATAVGLPGVINHGLGTLSLVAGGLVEHLAAGDGSRLRRLGVRFTDMVFPGSEVATTVWESEGSSYVFETTRPDGSIVMSGHVEVSAA
jgi:acyl dehydratase